ncbi:MATE family efflux transporter [Haloferula rosea]|uniref:Multidrug-efflux transporter n=1 Tax=Haloferula rosea TaxID=490093 RepID=A0A934RB26_9BACT|nr:MATE family efflux transporter [Haloferula rosea]MBK1827260.1 MATE family efflux transporter [Haloferula rosea]
MNPSSPIHEPDVPTLASEGRATIRLALPLIVGQLAQMLMGVVDTLMIGQVGVTELAASSFANTLIYVPMMFGIGMAVAVSIRVSQARGAKNPEAARAALRHGLQITTTIGVLTLLAAWWILPALGIFRQDPDVLEAMPRYFLLVAASMIPAMASMAVKNHADAMNRPWPMFWITFGSVLLNALLNWIFIFGRFGVPAMGLEGAGVATLLARTVAFAAMILWCVKSPTLREWVPYHWFRRPERKAIVDLIRIGFPTSMQLLAEVSAFVFAALMIGTMGEAALASHQIAISCAATSFMIPLGLSMALTVRMGEAWGSKELWRLRRILVSGWMIGLVFVLCSASAFLVFNDVIAGWFVQEVEARKLAAALLVVAAAFQFSDSMQVLSAGSLRGLDDVKIPAWLAFGAYWVIAIPLGWLLAFRLDWGTVGVWWGITIGLSLTAIALGLRVWRKTGEQGLAGKAY